MEPIPRDYFRVRVFAIALGVLLLGLGVLQAVDGALVDAPLTSDGRVATSYMKTARIGRTWVWERNRAIRARAAFDDAPASPGISLSGVTAALARRLDRAALERSALRVDSDTTHLGIAVRELTAIAWCALGGLAIMRGVAPAPRD